MAARELGRRAVLSRHRHPQLLPLLPPTAPPSLQAQEFQLRADFARCRAGAGAEEARADAATAEDRSEGGTSAAMDKDAEEGKTGAEEEAKGEGSGSEGEGSDEGAGAPVLLAFVSKMVAVPVKQLPDAAAYSNAVVAAHSPLPNHPAAAAAAGSGVEADHHLGGDDGCGNAFIAFARVFSGTLRRDSVCAGVGGRAGGRACGAVKLLSSLRRSCMCCHPSIRR